MIVAPQTNFNIPAVTLVDSLENMKRKEIEKHGYTIK